MGYNGVLTTLVIIEIITLAVAIIPIVMDWLTFSLSVTGYQKSSSFKPFAYASTLNTIILNPAQDLVSTLLLAGGATQAICVFFDFLAVSFLWIAGASKSNAKKSKAHKAPIKFLTFAFLFQLASIGLMGYAMYAKLVLDIVDYVDWAKNNNMSTNVTFGYTIGMGAYLAAASLILNFLTPCIVFCNRRKFRSKANIDPDEEPIMNEA